ncbi:MULTISPECIES: sulfur carrier protein ThiS [Rhizobium]|uniref:Sulfur carrier protein ThiS n=1 Tax=Rhizobium aouanii TaxID=3118145 RepID=A0ABU8CWJ1_9HYPH|nr:sulfur carrier protein ThiS [Rhizobium acaciae]MCW1414127.1 sulfur carrier protein ThiS [Rhizobium acaciae]MCW1746282.1 sulfur carrier protein ThiS [Rhizobium acaciae]MCW1754112.1 sulfur carrier protein ThiS [Rhizobium acaciae]
MKLIVNGEDHHLDALTLSDVMTTLEYEGGWLATAVNGELVHREERTECRLAEGDRIEILTALQGG